MIDSSDVHRTFTAPDDRCRRIAGFVHGFLTGIDSPRILDLGCGAGGQLIALADLVRCASLTGVDVSEASIHAAREAALRQGIADRIQFVRTGYLEFDDDPYDVIIADSVLQNIPDPNDSLYAKLARDLRPASGLLIASMPYDCLYNRLLWGVRRVLRTVRGRWLDQFAFRLVQWAHPGWDAELLRERIPYLYMLPSRFDGEAMRYQLKSQFNLELVQTSPVPHASWAQPKHRLLVFRKGL